jgi:hypothetical protein
MTRLLFALLLAAGPAVGAEWADTRVSSYDWACMDGETVLSSHQREGTAKAACSNRALKDGKTYFVQGGRYRITASAAAPLASLTATAASILPGTAINLTWDCSNATSATAGGAWGGNLSISGSKAVTPPATGTYSVTCAGPNGDAVVDVLVQVAPWKRVADEGGRYTCRTACAVRYGVAGRWSPPQTFAAGAVVPCSNQQFSDPAPGVAKYCEAMEAA